MGRKIGDGLGGLLGRLWLADEVDDEEYESEADGDVGQHAQLKVLIISLDDVDILKDHMQSVISGMFAYTIIWNQAGSAGLPAVKGLIYLKTHPLIVCSITSAARPQRYWPEAAQAECTIGSSEA